MGVKKKKHGLSLSVTWMSRAPFWQTNSTTPVAPNCRGTIVRQRKPQGSITFFGASGWHGNCETWGGGGFAEQTPIGMDQYGGLLYLPIPWIRCFFMVKEVNIQSSHGSYGTGYCKKSLKLTPSHRLHFPFSLFSSVFIHKRQLLESMFNQFDMMIQNKLHTHRIHVWYIYLHLSPKPPKCIGKYSTHWASGIGPLAHVASLLLDRWDRVL